MAGERIVVEVAAATAERQVLIEIFVPAGTTLARAVELADLPSRLPELEVDYERLGVFGKRRRPDEIVQSGDRVEVYRPLSADPKEVRRQLAELARQNKKG